MSKANKLRQVAASLEAEMDASFQYGGSEIAERFPETDAILETLGYDGPYSISANDMRQAANQLESV